MQIQKDEVRERILDSALSLFAAQGYRKASIKLVAEGAGVSVGNVYRYFPGKEELLREALPEGRIREIEAGMLEKLRILTLRGEADAWSGIDAADIERRQIEGFITRRREIAFLFNGSGGSPWEDFPERMAKALAMAFLDWARSIGASPPANGAMTARAFYRHFFSLVAGAFLEKGKGLERALSEYMAYHVSGMTALARFWIREGR